MDGFLENVGFMAICFAIAYGYMKIMEYYDESNLYESDKVHKAADEFVNGASFDDVKSILVSCLELDTEDAEKILSRSIPHRTDKDGGYRAFIKTVNKVLDEDVYNEQCHTH